jgi:MFS transporter, UMF1 family
MPMNVDSKGRFGWAMYDWAAQPFFTIIITFVFGPYFMAHVASDPLQGQSDWANAQAVAGFLLAITAPFLGSYADESGPRKPWVVGFSVVAIIATASLWFAEPGASPSLNFWTLAAIVLGVIGAEFAIVFNNAMLPSLARPDGLGKLSGLGWAMGYIGALVALPMMLWITGQLPGVAGPELDAQSHVGDRLAGPFTAVWFLLFMVPFLVWTPDEPTRNEDRIAAVKRGLSSTLKILKELPQRPNLMRYLIARMLYYDGLNAVFIFGGIYASRRFDWGTTELGLFGIIILLFGVPGCFLGGWLDDRLGSKATLNIFVTGLFVAMLGIVSIGDGQVLFVVDMAFPTEGDGLFASPAELVLVGFAALVGICAGPVQSCSRSLIARIAPVGQSGKYFGLFALSGKATSFVAPLCVGLALGFMGDRWAYAVILVFILAGLFVLRGVTEEREAS